MGSDMCIRDSLMRHLLVLLHRRRIEYAYPIVSGHEWLQYEGETSILPYVIDQDTNQLAFTILGQ